ncbi:MAG: class I SAM-dependent methyltransferase [Chloroflexi bacterium]|nr:class I SAM-dependent methyltransferase [Chloroflexota bacterium]
MVHALDEIRRVLKPGGILIDLRPVEANWSVEISSSAGDQVAGRLTDLPVAMADDEAAFHAMHEVESRGWFIKEREEEFAFFYSWDTPSEMKEFMDSEWEDFEKMEDHVFEQVKSLWALANADARPRIRVKMLISLWRNG